MPWEKVDSGDPGPQTIPDEQFQSDQDVAAEKEAKFGGPLNAAAAAATGFANTATFGGFNAFANLADKALGVDTSDVGEAINEQNPVSYGLGQAGAILTGAGAAGSAARAGEAVAGELGGGLATRLGVENALLTLGDETSKAFTSHPDSIQTAILHTGLSGILGAAAGKGLGTVSDLWTSKVGPKAEAFVKDFTDAMKANSDLSEKFPYTAPVEEEIAKLGKTPGQRAAEDIVNKASNYATQAASEGLGVAIGHMSGLPMGGYLGYIMGKSAGRLLKPMMSTYLPSLIKPILENESSAPGLKSAFDAVDSVMQGTSMLNKASKALFETGSSNLPVAEDHDIQQLNDKSLALSSHPEGMMALGGDIGHYLPQHQTALAMTAQNAVNYLESQRPKPIQQSMLDTPLEPSNSQWSSFNRTLGIAEQPLSILTHASKGTLIPKDMRDLHSLYPYLSQQISQSVGKALIEHKASGKTVPYRLRRGLSMLMGQPVDSSLTPQSLVSAQSTFVASQPPQQSQAQPKTKKSTAKLGKSAELAETPAMARMKVLQKA